MIHQTTDTTATHRAISSLAHIAPRNRLDHLMREYERNYGRLLYLVPNVARHHGRLLSSAVDMPDLQVEIVEQAAYTTTLHLDYRLMIDGCEQREPMIQLRGYHDARMLEVLSVYEPGPGGRFEWCPLRHSSLGRKWRFNRFLGKWLAYCMLQGHGHFRPLPEPVPTK